MSNSEDEFVDAREDAGLPNHRGIDVSRFEPNRGSQSTHQLSRNQTEQRSNKKRSLADLIREENTPIISVNEDPKLNDISKEISPPKTNIKNLFKDPSKKGRPLKLDEDLDQLTGVRQFGKSKELKKRRNISYDKPKPAVVDFDGKVANLIKTVNEKSPSKITTRSKVNLIKMELSGGSNISEKRKNFKTLYDKSDNEDDDDENDFDSDGEFQPKIRSRASPATRQSKPNTKGKRKPKASSSISKLQGVPGLIESIEDEDEDSSTNFIYLKEHVEIPQKPRPGKKKASVLKKNEEAKKSDVFSSPQKQKLGVLQLSSTLSPSRRGLLTSSPTKSPNGRAGSPRKIQRQKIQDASARKRANRTLYAKLLEEGVEDDEDDEDYKADLEIAEKIILDSKKSVSHKESPFLSPRKLKNYNLPTNNPDFKPTTLPTIEADEEFFESKYEDKALFLDGPDGFFDQHRTKVRTSNNSMVQAPQLDYDEFNSLGLISGFLHHPQKALLLEKYTEMYTQWRFEIQEGFNLVFYGIGSKRIFLLSFIEDYLLDHIDVPVVVVNGYNTATTFRDILLQVLVTLGLNKAPKRYSEAVDYLVDHFKTVPHSPQLILLIHNIDGESLRDEKIQDYLSKLASIRQITLISSIDHINAPLLWDSVRLSNFNFVWHNTTTFADYVTEISFKDPLSLGQTQKSAGSNGAKYVLSSLTNSSRSLYRVLATNQLQIMSEDLASKRDKDIQSLKGSVKYALEFSRFFLLCAEEFISSNELNFRTMLMEFVEHKMAVLTKDQAGTELVFIPFAMEEISKLIQEELT